MFGYTTQPCILAHEPIESQIGEHHRKTNTMKSETEEKGGRKRERVEEGGIE